LYLILRFLQRALRAMVVVVVLPLPQLVIEQVDIVADARRIQQRAKLLVIDPMRSLDLAVEMRRPWADVDVPDVQALEMPVKRDWNSAPLSVCTT
jgi:hypothetical protein